MAGMMRAGLALEEPRYIDFVKRWADHWRDKGLGPVLEGRPGAPIRGYCGHWGPGYPVIMLYERTRDPAYLEMARQIAAFIMTKATRTADGGLGHWSGNRQLWVDTLYMVCPPLVNLAEIDGRPEWRAEAVRQLEIYARRCQDADSGLFHHMYDEPNGRNVGSLWARGNGWVAMSYVEVLRQLDRRSPEHARLVAAFRRQVDGLLRTLDADERLWHTILDRPETYVETSGSAMILHALDEGRRLGLIRVERKLIADVWARLAGRVDRDGRVTGVSGGTRPGPYAEYADKPLGTETWGTGAFLMAACGLHDDAGMEKR